jgi:hypothetical protein
MLHSDDLIQLREEQIARPITKTNLQGSRAQVPKTLQSRNHPCGNSRLTINGLAVLHNRLAKEVPCDSQIPMAQ